MRSSPACRSKSGITSGGFVVLIEGSIPARLEASVKITSDDPESAQYARVNDLLTGPSIFLEGIARNPMARLWKRVQMKRRQVMQAKPNSL